MPVQPFLCPELSTVPSLEAPLEEAFLENLLQLPLHPLRVADRYHPATVYLGWAEDQLFVVARQEDRDIHSTSTDRNQPLWALGDVFEIFLQVDGHPDYLELHVSPNAHTLQLRFPSEAEMRADRVKGKGLLAKYTLGGDLFDFRVRFRPEGWDVLALLPFETIRPGFTRDGNRTLRASFCRYDYSRDTEEPDLSSTSLHATPDFHRLFEWLSITLAPCTSGE